uniref:FRAS1-related extracellular matrix protein 2 n=1 Tax=Zeugodacus cucurbitae TaxID=28588 RepID=A0A0A1X4Y1_ZEUCU
MYEKSQSAANLYSYADNACTDQMGGFQNGNNVRKSHTTDNCMVERKRGLKPSDRRNPLKKQFLISLSKQIWRKSDESTNASKHIDLHKIFTPATDNDAVLPRNRKLYSSSAFYSPALHPTVEDQVELARRISHSLSDISNQKSKGQSMYVNRKKRSVKWVHEGAGQGTIFLTYIYV